MADLVTFKIALTDCLTSCYDNLNIQTVEIIIPRLESAVSAISLWVDNFGNYEAEFRPIRATIEEALILLESLTSEESIHATRRIGRPKIDIPIHSVEELLAMNFRVTKIAEMYSVHPRTIYRLLADYGLSVTSSYSVISETDLIQVVTSVLLEYPNTGYKRMKGYLLQRNIKVTDVRVREVMRTADPQGVYQRTLQNRAIVRRTYYVRYSNGMWHLDTNMKLIRWKVVIRGAVDGKSRTALYLEAGGDNTAVSNLNSFKKGVSRYGVPIRCRSDKGGENVLVARYMIETRGCDRSSHICGRSVHNQRIERFWRDVFYGCTSFYYNVFSRLEADGILDIDDEKHIVILHYIFLPRMNNHLEGFREGWNHHPLSSESNKTPRQLMLMHLPPENFDLIPSEEDLMGIQFVCNNADDLLNFETNGNDTIINPLVYDNVLSEIETLLLTTINPLKHSTSYGYDLFQDALLCLNR